MNKTNCPNCGAPIIHSYTYNCLYCGTLLNSNVNKIMDTKNKEIRDFEIISIEETQMFFGIEIFIKCKIREIPIMSEFNDDNCSPYASVVMPSNLNSMGVFKLRISRLDLEDYEHIYTNIYNEIPLSLKKYSGEIIHKIIKFCNEHNCALNRYIWKKI